MKRGAKVPVTMRAVVQRINRRLATEYHGLRKLKATRDGGWARHDFGDFYVLDLGRNNVVERHVDPEGFGRKLGVLQPWEEVAE